MENGTSKNQNTAETEQAKNLSEITTDELTLLKVNELRELCRIEQLPLNGKKSEMIDRLLTKKLGRSERYIGRQTKCQFCGESVRITGTTTQKMKDGKILITRQIKCNGLRRHTYPLKEIV